MLVDTLGGRTVRRNAEVRTRSSAPNSRAKLVVVVDDEPNIQEVVSMILESEGGYEVRWYLGDSVTPLETVTFEVE